MRSKLPFFLLVVFGLLFAAALWRHGGNYVLLTPQGEVATKERSLILTALGLMLIVVVPVYILTAVIALRYREGSKATYQPEWDHNVWLEAIWWLIPCAIIFTLAGIAWRSSHELDPKQALASSKTPITIEVVALQWKWLFIYPEQKLATVNYVEFPAATPVHFEITADAPMNSFWIPALGGQIYAMPGMSTELQLMADQPGDFRGVSANISGAGFAGMHFTATATTDEGFQAWVAGNKNAAGLGANQYAALVVPSENNPTATYALTDQNLYTEIINKYMQHSH